MHTPHTKLLLFIKHHIFNSFPPLFFKYACSYIIIRTSLEDIHTLFSACQQDYTYGLCLKV